MLKDKYAKLEVFHFADDLKRRHTKKQLKCLIFGNFGAKNFGDEAILTGQIQELQKIPGITITVAARFPEDVIKLHKVHALNLYAVDKIRREIRKSDFIIIGGGGLINKVERNVIGFVFQLYMLFIFFVLPRMYRKKVYILGMGIYDNANAFIINLALPFLRNAAIITVRDFHSYEFLKSKKIMSSLYKDNSFLMDLVPAASVLKNNFFQKNYTKRRNNIGISLLKPESKKEEKQLLCEIMTFIEKYKENASFWFYAADVNPNYPNDTVIGNQLAAEVKEKYGQSVAFSMVPTTVSPQLFFSSFTLMNYFVAMRFHAGVFAYRNKIPFVGISYDKKCSSFIESVGQKPFHLKSFSCEDYNQILVTGHK